MRLTCPNCRAQYEIDGSVIPETGRDVQCSACSTTWFQYPETLEKPLPDDSDADAEEPVPAATVPRIDQSVLDVLREEAERELSERRRNSETTLETQGDLGLVTRPRAPGSSQRSDPPPYADDDTDAKDETPPPSRRNLLPDIEELSSTLQPGNAPRRAGSAETTLPPVETDDRAGFRQGLLLTMLVALLLIGLYALAPIISQQVPALAEPMAGYLALVDSLRTWIADSLRTLFERISEMG